MNRLLSRSHFSPICASPVDPVTPISPRFEATFRIGLWQELDISAVRWGLNFMEEQMSSIPTRRTLLYGAASSLVLVALVPKVRAADLIATPQQTEGPFYPVAIPPDADNDLVKVAGKSGEAKGTITYVAGRVLDRNGRPVSGATVEIWQCDHQGHYLHPGDRGPRDDGFQGFGRMATTAEGGYRFRTIRPVPYTGRTPHIHFAVLTPGRPRLVTQMYVDGEQQNERDGIYRRLDPAQRRAVTVTLAPRSAAEPGALAGTFDLILPG
jgi:protocatechuate 3,4-dioxygenase, beta subunit